MPMSQGGLADIIRARQELLDRMARLDALATTFEHIVRQTLSALIGLREELTWVVAQQAVKPDLLPQLAAITAQTEVAAELSQQLIAQCRQGMSDAKNVLVASEALVAEIEAATSEPAALQPGVKQAFFLVRASIRQGEALVMQTARSAETFLDRSREIEVIRTKVRRQLHA